MLLSERADAFAVAIKDDDGVTGDLRLGSVRDVNQTFRVDAGPVRVLPLDGIGHFAPVVMALVRVLTLSHNRWFRAGLVRRVQKRRSDC